MKKIELEQLSFLAPDGIDFAVDPAARRVTMTFLSWQSLGLRCSALYRGEDGKWTAALPPFNLQDNRAAFEAWAALLLAHAPGWTVRLDVVAEPPVSPDGESRFAPGDPLPSGRGPFPDVIPERRRAAVGDAHYGRFLYRALCFSRQFADRFTLSPALARVVEEFALYLEQRGRRFSNNIPLSEAHAGDRSAENRAEASFGQNPALLRDLLRRGGFAVGEDFTVWRQLPVGLFEGGVASGRKRVFPGRKSAVDLWAVEGDRLLLFELKTAAEEGEAVRGNCSMGGLSELFFYANLLRDLYLEENTLMPRPPRGEFRGYCRLIEACPQVKQVQAFLLTDPESLHPQLQGEEGEAVFRLLSGGRPGITYHRLPPYDRAALPEPR
ncbi:MAG: hypothetical protein IJC43_05365 [Clostridia bacterium]|nr:hypothetical protein [Clostridia bacterium]